jgi:hypothetical protein
MAEGVKGWTGERGTRQPPVHRRERLTGPRSARDRSEAGLCCWARGTRKLARSALGAGATAARRPGMEMANCCTVAPLPVYLMLGAGGVGGFDHLGDHASRT